MSKVRTFTFRFDLSCQLTISHHSFNIGFATSSKSWAVPIPYMYKCLQAFERIRRELEFTMRRELGEIVFKAIKNRITNLTEKEVKEINPSAIIKLLDLTTSYISDTEFMGDLRRLLLIYILDKLMN